MFDEYGNPIQQGGYNPMAGFQNPNMYGPTTQPIGSGMAGAADPGMLASPIESSWFDSLKNGFNNSGFLQSKDPTTGMTTGGWGTAAMGIAQGVGNAYMGMKQYGLAKDQLALSKRAFEQNYAAQRQSANTSLEDRQRARVASNPGAYQSVGSYMNQNRIA